MSDILSQEEIEALLATLTSDDGGGDTAPSPIVTPGSGTATQQAVGKRSETKRAPIAYGLYDFRRPDKFSRDQLRTMQMLHETFGRLATSSLSAYLRTSCHIELISLEQVPYDEYLRAINKSVFVVYNLPPLSGQAVLEIEFALIYTMLDRLLGGPGKTEARSAMTEIERGLTERLSTLLFSSMKGAWDSVLPIHPSVDSIETSSQFVQIAPPNDIVVTILFEVKIGEQRGTMSVCIPYLVLKPVTQKLNTQRWFSSGPKKATPAIRKQMAAEIGRTMITCAAQLGRTKLKIRDLLALKAGDVIRLDQTTEQDINIMVGSKPKFKGKPATKNKKLVVTITHIEED